MIRKKSWPMLFSTLNSSVPLLISSPLFATAITIGADAMLRDAIRSRTEDGLVKLADLAEMRFTRSLFFSPFKMMNFHDC